MISFDETLGSPTAKAGEEGEANHQLQDRVVAEDLTVAQLGDGELLVQSLDAVPKVEAVGLHAGGNVVAMDAWRAAHPRPTPKLPRQQADQRAEAGGGNAVYRAEQVRHLLITYGHLLAELARRVGAPALSEDGYAMIQEMAQAVELPIYDSLQAVPDSPRDWREDRTERPEPGLIEDLTFENTAQTPDYRLTIRLVRLLPRAGEEN